MPSGGPARRGAVLAIDHGGKRTGFAVADALRVSVQPLETHHGPGSGERLLEHVGLLLAERDVECVVVGHPLRADGRPGARAAVVDVFVAALRAHFPATPVVRWDERLTTKEAESLLREAGHHGEARKRRRDSWSAMVLLEDWIRSGEPR